MNGEIIDSTTIAGGPRGMGGPIDCTGSFNVQCLQNIDLMTLVPILIAYAFLGAAILSVFFVFYGGISFILSGGDDEKIKKSVNTIRYAIIGFVIAVLSFFIVFVIGRILGLELEQFLSYDQIIGIITNLGGGNENNFEVQ